MAALAPDLAAGAATSRPASVAGRNTENHSPILRKLPVSDQPDAQAVPLVPRLAYSVQETADALGVSRDTIHELIRTGRLHSVKAGARTLIGVRQIEAFLAGEDAAAS
jgi:excisionase family DNA binding protein